MAKLGLRATAAAAAVVVCYVASPSLLLRASLDYTTRARSTISQNNFARRSLADWLAGCCYCCCCCCCCCRRSRFCCCCCVCAALLCVFNFQLARSLARAERLLPLRLLARPLPTSGSPSSCATLPLSPFRRFSSCCWLWLATTTTTTRKATFTLCVESVGYVWQSCGNDLVESTLFSPRDSCQKARHQPRQPSVEAERDSQRHPQPQRHHANPTTATTTTKSQTATKLRPPSECLAACHLNTCKPLTFAVLARFGPICNNTTQEQLANTAPPTTTTTKTASRIVYV